MENEEDDPEEAPTGSPGLTAEENETRNDHPIVGEDSTIKDNNRERTSRIVTGPGQEPKVKNRIEQYLIGTSGTSTPSRTSGGNMDKLHKVKKSGTTLKTARGNKKKTTNFTPSKQKIFNFFERNGDLGSSPAWKKTNQQNPSVQDLPQMAPKTKPNQTTGQGSMGEKPAF